MKSINEISEQISRWLESLDPAEQSDVEQVWEDTKHSDPADKITLSDKEKAASLAHIKRELNLDEASKTDNHNNESGTSFFSQRWLAIAAALAIAALTSYLFIPVERTAPLGEQLTVTLPDQSTVTLNSGSELRYNRLFGYTNRNAELNGEAFFEVKSSGQPFVVETFNASVRVLGTKFNLRSWAADPGAETTVTLTEGKLTLESIDSESEAVMLTPGEQSSVKGDDTVPTLPSPSEVDQVLSWIEGRLAFENRPIGQIFNEIERRYNVDIDVESNAILNDSLTIYYSNRINAEEAIKDICLSKGVTYRRINNGFVIEQ